MPVTPAKPETRVAGFVSTQRPASLHGRDSYARHMHLVDQSTILVRFVERMRRTHGAKGERWFGFDSVRDLDGLPPKVLMVPLSGHIWGHAGVAVRHFDGHWLFMPGTAAGIDSFQQDWTLSPPPAPQLRTSKAGWSPPGSFQGARCEMRTSFS